MNQIISSNTTWLTPSFNASTICPIVQPMFETIPQSVGAAKALTEVASYYFDKTYEVAQQVFHTKINKPILNWTNQWYGALDVSVLAYDFFSFLKDLDFDRPASTPFELVDRINRITPSFLKTSSYCGMLSSLIGTGITSSVYFYNPSIRLAKFTLMFTMLPATLGLKAVNTLWRKPKLLIPTSAVALSTLGIALGYESCSNEFEKETSVPTFSEKLDHYALQASSLFSPTYQQKINLAKKVFLESNSQFQKEKLLLEKHYWKSYLLEKLGGTTSKEAVDTVQSILSITDETNSRKNHKLEVDRKISVNTQLGHLDRVFEEAIKFDQNEIQRDQLVEDFLVNHGSNSEGIDLMELRNKFFQSNSEFQTELEALQSTYWKNGLIEMGTRADSLFSMEMADKLFVLAEGSGFSQEDLLKNHPNRTQCSTRWNKAGSEIQAILATSLGTLVEDYEDLTFDYTQSRATLFDLRERLKFTRNDLKKVKEIENLLFNESGTTCMKNLDEAKRIYNRNHPDKKVPNENFFLSILSKESVLYSIASWLFQEPHKSTSLK